MPKFGRMDFFAGRKNRKGRWQHRQAGGLPRSGPRVRSAIPGMLLTPLPLAISKGVIHKPSPRASPSIHRPFGSTTLLTMTYLSADSMIPSAQTCARFCDQCDRFTSQVSRGKCGSCFHAYRASACHGQWEPQRTKTAQPHPILSRRPIHC